MDSFLRSSVIFSIIEVVRWVWFSYSMYCCSMRIKGSHRIYEGIFVTKINDIQQLNSAKEISVLDFLVALDNFLVSCICFSLIASIFSYFELNSHSFFWECVILLSSDCPYVISIRAIFRNDDLYAIYKTFTVSKICFINSDLHFIFRSYSFSITLLLTFQYSFTVYPAIFFK